MDTPGQRGDQAAPDPVGDHVTHSETQTVRLAEALAEHLGPRSWVGLMGPLGAGKSVFVRAVGHALGVTGPMPSPTYNLMTTHRGRCEVCHIDLYRIHSLDELDFAGLASYFYGPGVCLVEWAEKAKPMWPADGWTVTFEMVDETSRRIAIRRFDVRE